MRGPLVHVFGGTKHSFDTSKHNLMASWKL